MLTPVLTLSLLTLYFLYVVIPPIARRSIDINNSPCKLHANANYYADGTTKAVYVIPGLLGPDEKALMGFAQDLGAPQSAGICVLDWSRKGYNPKLAAYRIAQDAKSFDEVYVIALSMGCEAVDHLASFFPEEISKGKFRVLAIDPHYTPKCASTGWLFLMRLLVPILYCINVALGSVGEHLIFTHDNHKRSVAELIGNLVALTYGEFNSSGRLATYSYCVEDADVFYARKSYLVSHWKDQSYYLDHVGPFVIKAPHFYPRWKNVPSYHWNERGSLCNFKDTTTFLGYVFATTAFAFFVE